MRRRVGRGHSPHLRFEFSEDDAERNIFHTHNMKPWDLQHGPGPGGTFAEQVVVVIN